MCDRICKTCGGDDSVAKIAERMLFRPDIAYLRIKKLEADILTLVGRLYDEDDATFAPETYDVMKRYRPVFEKLYCKNQSH